MLTGPARPPSTLGWVFLWLSNPSRPFLPRFLQVPLQCCVPLHCPDFSSDVISPRKRPSLSDQRSRPANNPTAPE